MMGRLLSAVLLMGLGAFGLLVFAPAAEFDGRLGDVRETVRETLSLDHDGADSQAVGAPGAPEAPAPGSSTAGLHPEVPEEREAEIEQMFHAMINETRAEHGLPELTFDEELAVVARYHSEQMAAQDFFAHMNPNTERDATDRGHLFDYTCRKVEGLFVRSGLGENLYKSTGGPDLSPEREAERAIEGLMDSPGHRENILRDVYETEGIGVHEADGSIWLTQNFC